MLKRGRLLIWIYLSTLIVAVPQSACQGGRFVLGERPRVMVLAGGGDHETGLRPGSEGARDLSTKFFRLASAAVRDKESSIVVGSISFTKYWHGGAFEHRFLVSEVLKPFRTDRDVYYIPTSGMEQTASARNPHSQLETGRKYVLLIRLASHLYRAQWIEGAYALSGTPEECNETIEAVRAYASESPRYGSSRLLSVLLDRSVDKVGRRSARRDGYIPPSAFQLGKKEVLKAVSGGARLVLSRILDAREEPNGPADVLVEILEDFSKEGKCQGEKIWIRLTVEYIDSADRREHPYPFRRAKFLRGYVHILLLRPRVQQSPLLIARMSPIGDDDATVREVRSWFRKQ